ncbi:hypothetical protein NEUTE1DRAFT_127034 [Neurospora tetrasperma FGSC 2508]|uniref:Galactose oxidase n=1 Tax=Neurospora tetrasperma (strain FGSC 2508 / ATCC MYA-4615 / P0657) TaxID=510951 RepID=F8N0J8_NEUT8|nr:uncharacterized protein NEUTE1DRAFT_127034 [Neurospora tetrasperma FGSC 2508]EGO53826.1 hypothetical protein NEUTE1DRAFT_127034 [Neurospora tetrasperma FGSC 2508]EGZ76088.1 hypothetical protein NEUTE2DRAFT_153121 [Neurospora tetrasperma FGSC 2509]
MKITTLLWLLLNQLLTLCLARAQKCNPDGFVKSKFEQNQGLRYVNLSDENRILHIQSVPDDVPQVAMGALWSDNTDRLFLFGGQYSNSSASAPSAVETVWSYTESTGSWEKISVQNPPAFRLARGASVSVPETRKAYWMGGWADNSTTFGMHDRIYQRQLIEFDMKTHNFSYYDVPGGFGVQRTGGGLVYLPYGKKGVLIAMGGSMCTSEDCHPVPSYHPLTQVSVYDLASERIYSQETTTGNGDPTTKGWVWPEARADFCMVTVPSYDETVHAVYAWGGMVGPDGNGSDNVWVLLIPQFVWVEVYNGPYGRFGATCQVTHERFMMFSGGERQFGSNMGVLDLTTVSNGWWDGWVEAWQDLTDGQRYPAVEPWFRYNPRFAAYHLGSSLRRVAGNPARQFGDESPADIQRPFSGWSHSELKLIFSPSNHTRPNPFRTKNYLAAAKITSALLIVIPFFIYMALYLYSLLQFKRQGYMQVVSGTTSMTWRPFFTRNPYLLFLALSSLSLLVVVELLYQHSINPAFEPGHRIMHTNGSEPSPPGYYPTIASRPRLGLYTYWDSESTDFKNMRGTSSRLKLEGYVVWNYLPTIVVVLYGLLWQQCDAEVERIEPYYHLFNNNMKQTADRTLNVDYHTFWVPLRLWQAVKYRQWTCFLSSTAYIIAFAVIPNLQNSLFSLEKRHGGTYGDLVDFANDADGVGYGVRVAVMDGSFARALEVMFRVNMLCAVALMAIFWQRGTSTEGSGLYGDPRGMKWLKELTEEGELMGATSFPDDAQPMCQLLSPRALQGFVDDPDGLDEWARNHLCWTEFQGGGLRLKFECAHEPAQTRSKPFKPLLKSIQDFLNQKWDIHVQRKPFMLNLIPLTCLISAVLLVFAVTLWILCRHLMAIKSQDDTIPLPPELYLVIGVLVKASLTSFLPSF